MVDHSSEAANRSAQEAAGPPPAANALASSGLVDQSKGFLRKLVDRASDVLGGSRARK